MFNSEPKDVLIECKGCGIENLFNAYTPGSPTVCNQCREYMVDSTVDETHVEYACEDCKFTMLLLNDTPVSVGETACRCGSSNLIKRDSSSLAEEALHFSGSLGDQNEGEEAADDNEEVDWIRSEPGVLDDMEEYEDLFDQDPGMN